MNCSKKIERRTLPKRKSNAILNLISSKFRRNRHKTAAAAACPSTRSRPPPPPGASESSFPRGESGWRRGRRRRRGRPARIMSGEGRGREVNSVEGGIRRRRCCWLGASVQTRHDLCAGHRTALLCESNFGGALFLFTHRLRLHHLQHAFNLSTSRT